MNADVSGATALLTACSVGSLECVNALAPLEKLVNIPDSQGMTPLMVACAKVRDVAVMMMMRMMIFMILTMMISLRCRALQT